MINESKTRSAILFFGDLLLLYAALLAILLVRYAGSEFQRQLILHWQPFSVLFFFWILIFYIGGLYNPRSFKSGEEFSRAFRAALLINSALAVGFFYLVPFFGIAPKTNLFAFIALFGLADYWIRSRLGQWLATAGFKNRLLIIGGGESSVILIERIKNNPQTGYEIGLWKKDLKTQEYNDLFRLIAANKINTVVIPHDLKKELSRPELIYRLMSSGVNVAEFSLIYEAVFQKVPLNDLEEGWLLGKIAPEHRFFDASKRLFDIFLALLISAVLWPLGILIAVFIHFASSRTDRGPIIYRQKRLGKNAKEFTIYKFRTMRPNAEINGAVWAKSDDERITPLGKILRRTHLDEIPQLYNIIKGDLSFVGPRPERPEFIKDLKIKIPYYNIRHLVNPGITGWAQINYRYGASAEDALEKLQYDLYYIKNRSFLLDLAIIVKTIKLLFVILK